MNQVVGDADRGDRCPDTAHFIKGKTIKEIAWDLKVSRNNVRKELRSGETSFEYERAVQPRSKLGLGAAELDRVLAANATTAAREQLTLIRIFEELRGRGYDGGYDAVRCYAINAVTRPVLASNNIVFIKQPENRVGCHAMSAGRLEWEWQASAVVIVSMRFLLPVDLN